MKSFEGQSLGLFDKGQFGPKSQYFFLTFLVFLNVFNLRRLTKLMLIASNDPTYSLFFLNSVDHDFNYSHRFFFGSDGFSSFQVRVTKNEKV